MGHGCSRNVPGLVGVADIPADNSTNLFCWLYDPHLCSADVQAVCCAILGAWLSASCSYSMGLARVGGHAVVAGVPEGQRSIQAHSSHSPTNAHSIPLWGVLGWTLPASKTTSLHSLVAAVALAAALVAAAAGVGDASLGARGSMRLDWSCPCLQGPSHAAVPHRMILSVALGFLRYGSVARC